MVTPIWQWSAVDTAGAIRDRRVSAEEVVRAHLERMRAANPAINAIVVDLSAQAIVAALAADRALAQGATQGKLHGVPVTIKINIDVKGQAIGAWIPESARRENARRQNPDTRGHRLDDQFRRASAGDRRCGLRLCDLRLCRQPRDSFDRLGQTHGTR